jgi:hypothetical protein
MNVPDWLAWVLLLIPVFTSVVFLRMSIRAARDMAGWKRATTLPLSEARLVIGTGLTLISLANIQTGLGYVDQIGSALDINIATGAIVVRGALLPIALYVLLRYRGG